MNIRIPKLKTEYLPHEQVSKELNIWVKPYLLVHPWVCSKQKLLILIRHTFNGAKWCIMRMRICDCLNFV